jgi:hypothetical protein
MANYKFTGLGVGSAAGDSANLSQVQSTAVKLLASVSGADTITAVGSPNVAAYVAGQMFYFVAAAANTGAVTINIDSLGAKSITRDGTTALAAGDIQSGEVCVIVYDGTQFQLVNGASQSAAIVTNSLTVNGTSSLDGAVTINDSGADVDFRVEGDSDANLLFVDASTDRVGVGTNAPIQKLDVSVASATEGSGLAVTNSQAGGFGSGATFYSFRTDGTTKQAAGQIAMTAIGAWSSDAGVSSAMQFFTVNANTLAERMRLDASGNLLVGTTSALNLSNVQISVGSGASSTPRLGIFNTASTPTSSASTAIQMGFLSGSANYVATDTILGSLSFLGQANDEGYGGASIQAQVVSGGNVGRASGHGVNLIFNTKPTDNTGVLERARITSDGSFLVGQSTPDGSVVGASIRGSGAAKGCVIATTDSFAVSILNRLTNDGDLILFRQDNNDEGSISVSGNTVSYNPFMGSHYTEIVGEMPTLKGTVLESVDELVTGKYSNQDRLPKAKISDTAGSKAVYGVYFSLDSNPDTDDGILAAALGASWVRVNGSVTVQKGDLLESNGDGTARVQADDIIRSSTIGKVTSTVKTHEYDDGSYCVPTVLYCG